MNNENLKRRTKQFALDIMKIVEGLPPGRIGNVLGNQLLRAACRTKSPADFISKLGNVEEEADESGFWMELLLESGKVRTGQVAALMAEANELLAIMVASINTARRSKARR